MIKYRFNKLINNIKLLRIQNNKEIHSSLIALTYQPFKNINKTPQKIHKS